MRILILTQYYPPEVGAAQNRLSSLATSLREAGHTVTVLTALPNYPNWTIYEDYKNCLVVTEIKGGITIHTDMALYKTGPEICRQINPLSLLLSAGIDRFGF